jgi:hypothetical protein
MNQLDTTTRIRVIACLVKGNSIRVTCRMTGVAKNTVAKLLLDLGKASTEYQDKAMVNLPCKRLQCDEIWSFPCCKQANVKKGEECRGDAWTWTAICVDTKLVLHWHVGLRDIECAISFIETIYARVPNRAQISTDAFKGYFKTIAETFKEGVDYGQIRKAYSSSTALNPWVKYSPPDCTSVKKTAMIGNPDKEHISTSFVERQNLTMRIPMRRFTPLTNTFSKKVENLQHAAALHFMHYNFCRIHQTLQVTPAMEAGITNHVWNLKEVVDLLG